MESEYVIPPQVRLDHPELPAALAAVGIQQEAVLAGGVFSWVFLDRLRPRRLTVVESPTSEVSSEIIGDAVLWLLVRGIALQVCTAPALAATGGGTVELGDVAVA